MNASGDLPQASVIKFPVPGDPIPQPRPRVTTRGVYYPERARGSKSLSYVDYKEWVATCYKNNFAAWAINYYNSRNTTYCLSLRVYLRGHELGDTNAFAATIMDALEGIVWANDRQVSELRNIKRFYCDPNPRVEVEIEEV